MIKIKISRKRVLEIDKNNPDQVIHPAGGDSDYQRSAHAGMEEQENLELPEQKELEEKKKKKTKKDRCYKLAKRKYKVFPSAYASGFIVRCRKGKVAKKKNENISEEENLKKWFDRQGEPGKGSGWVDCNTCRTDPETGRKKCKSCGRKEGEKRSKYPACRPSPSACTKKGTSSKKSSKRVSWKSEEE